VQQDRLQSEILSKNRPSWHQKYSSFLHRNIVSSYKLIDIQIAVQPSIETIQQLLKETSISTVKPNLVPICASVSAEFLTPSSIYLKVSAQ